MKVSMVIPCYNSEKTVGAVTETIIDILKNSGYDWEIILVNDCSKDSTWDIILELSEQFDNIKGLNLAKNAGQHAAIMAGMRQSTGSIIMCSDDDGQTPVEHIPSMIKKLIEEDYDVVSAKYVRFEKKGPIRRLGTYLHHIIFNTMVDKPKDVELRVYMAAKRFVIDEICKYHQPYTSINGLIFRVTHRIGNIEMVQHKRKEGKSGYSLRKLIHTWVSSFTAFSIVPLRFATILGLTAAGAGLLAFVVIVLRKLFSPEIAIGWTSTMALVLLMSGLLLFGLGIIGEYVGRIYMCINGTPQYVIRDSTDVYFQYQGKKEDNTLCKKL